MTSATTPTGTKSLTWDVTSSLTETTTVDGAHTVYAYDATGQRVLQATAAQRFSPGTATAYTPAGQIEDADTSATTVGDVTGTRYYTFGGATVAVRTHDGNLALVLGDEQGSVSVTMPVTVNPDGTMASATVADAQTVTRTSYTPYGQLRGADNLALDRGWLGQVEDRADATTGTGTGLTYLNARYYDPVLARFISPDPLMDPGDPKTLDPYRYADNNPVVFTDATGLFTRTNPMIDGVGGTKAAVAKSEKKANSIKAVQAQPGYVSAAPKPSNPGAKKPSSGGSGATAPSSGVVGGAFVAASSGTGTALLGPLGGSSLGAGLWEPPSGAHCDTWVECWHRQFSVASDMARAGLKELGMTAAQAARSTRPAWVVVSHLEAMGPVMLAVGTVLSAGDAYLRIGDMG